MFIKQVIIYFVQKRARFCCLSEHHNVSIYPAYAYVRSYSLYYCGVLSWMFILFCKRFSEFVNGFVCNTKETRGILAALC